MKKLSKGLARLATAKGFTIIELIVVIAIIAVLAGIVLVNVTQYINKGKDAALRGNMSTMQTNASVYYDSDPGNKGSFTGFTTSSGFIGPKDAIGHPIITTCDVGTAGSCGDNAQAWCAMDRLSTGKTYCVDSSGAKKEETGGGCAAGVCTTP